MSAWSTYKPVFANQSLEAQGGRASILREIPRFQPVHELVAMEYIS